MKHFKRGVWRDAPLAFTSTPGRLVPRSLRAKREAPRSWIPRCHRSRRRTRHVKRKLSEPSNRSPRRFRIGQRNRAGSKLPSRDRRPRIGKKERKNGAMADPALRKARRDRHRAYGKEKAAKREARSPQELSRPPSDPFCSRDGIGPVLFQSPFVSEKSGTEQPQE